MVFVVRPAFTYGEVYQDDDESLTVQDKIDYLAAINAAVASGELDEEEAEAMVAREKELNDVR